MSWKVVSQQAGHGSGPSDEARSGDPLGSNIPATDSPLQSARHPTPSNPPTSRLGTTSFGFMECSPDKAPQLAKQLAGQVVDALAQVLLGHLRYPTRCPPALPSLFCQVAVAYLQDFAPQNGRLHYVTNWVSFDSTCSGLPQGIAMLHHFDSKGDLNSCRVAWRSRAKERDVLLVAGRFPIPGTLLQVDSALSGAEAIRALWRVTTPDPTAAVATRAQLCTPQQYADRISTCLTPLIDGSNKWWTTRERSPSPDARRAGRGSTPTAPRKIDREQIYDLLMNARQADWVELTLADGRSLQGAIIFNEFKGTGRLINVDDDISFDFNVDQVVDVEIMRS